MSLLDRSWQEVQHKTFTKWLNTKLSSNELAPAVSLKTDLSDGIRLINLLEIIGDETLGKYNKNPRLRIQKAENVNKALDYIKSRGIPLTNIGAEDIIDGNLKLILGLLWTLILRFTIADINEEGYTAKEGLLLWCQRQTAGYSNVNICDFTTRNMRHLLYLPLRSPCTYKSVSILQESWVNLFLLNKKNPEIYKKPPALLLVTQFEPTYTCGRRESNHFTLSDIQFLETQSSAVFVKTSRGGQTTFHGPGQIVGYLILDLGDFQITPKHYVYQLESSLLAVCKTFGLTAIRTEHRGVWISPTRKIASIGLHLRRHITSHGIALNVSTDLRYFDKIIACGLVDKEMTSFERENVHVPLDIVQSCWVKQLITTLQCTIEQIDDQQANILLSTMITR
ncbi:hypothetical protein PCK1_002221 [Pneumocystis canis]|nr:hypothetical protein PCK1_002221 [Pneumocystis canis]